MAAEVDVPAAPEPPAGPTKVVTAELTVQLRAAFLQFDFEGLSDARSVRTILGHVAPRNCVLVNASTKARGGGGAGAGSSSCVASAAARPLGSQRAGPATASHRRRVASLAAAVHAPPL